MSTKKKLIELVGKIASIEKEEKSAFSQINAYEIAQDKPKLLKELSKLYEELERKKNTPITKGLLAKNGFEVLTPRVALPFQTWRLKENLNFWFDEYVEDRIYLDDGNFGKVDKGAFLIHLTSVRTDLKTVADLEDALDLCGIKDIEL